MFYICFKERERGGGEERGRIVMYVSLSMRVYPHIYVRYVYVTSWRVFHEMDDANAMTLRIPGDERSFPPEQGNLSEYARELRSSLLELFKGRIFTVVSRGFIRISYSRIRE